MKKTLKQIFFEVKNDKKYEQRYKAHTFLNIGQAIFDIANLKSFPDAKSVKDSIKNRSKSIALNLFYAAVDPTTHHGDEIEEMDEHDPVKWLKIGSEELETKKKDSIKENFLLVKENIDKEIKEIPKDTEDHFPPFAKMNLTDEELEILEKNLALTLDKIGYSKEKIILMLLATIKEMQK